MKYLLSITNVSVRRAVLLASLGVGSFAASAPAAESPWAHVVADLDSNDEATRLKAADKIADLGIHLAETVPPMIDLLQDPSPKVRAHAAFALSKLGGLARPAVPSLLKCLSDEDPGVRRQAIAALMAVKLPPGESLPLMVKLLEDSDTGTRVRILQAIASAGPEAVPRLITALQNEQAAYWACLVLREMGPAAKDAAPALGERLKDERPEVRREAVLALAAMEEAAAPLAPQIAALLNDEATRVAATYALGRIGKVSPEIENQLKANAKSTDPLLYSTTLWALANMHPENKEVRAAITERLIARLMDKDPYVRVLAARALASLPPAPEVTMPVWEKALANADETMITYALDSLAQMGPQAMPQLLNALKHEKLRMTVIELFGQIGPGAAPATEALTALLQDPDENVVHAVILTLAKIGPGAKAAAPALTQELAKGDSPHAHLVAYALGKIAPDSDAVQAELLKALASSDANLSLASAWALAQHPAPTPELAGKLVPILTKGLESPVDLGQQAAAEALGQLGPLAQDAVPALTKTAQDPDPGVQAASKKALAAIQAKLSAP